MNVYITTYQEPPFHLNYVSLLDVVLVYIECLRSLTLLKIVLQAYLCQLKSINCLTPRFIWVDAMRFTIFNNCFCQVAHLGRLKTMNQQVSWTKLFLWLFFVFLICRTNLQKSLVTLATTLFPYLHDSFIWKTLHHVWTLCFIKNNKSRNMHRPH